MTDLKRAKALAQRRVVIEGIDPEIDGGRFAAKAVAGRTFRVECDAYADGHDVVRCELHLRPAGGAWQAKEMAFVVNDRWAAEIAPTAIGPHEYRILAWRDPFAAWRRDTGKKIAANQNVDTEAEEGRQIVKRARAGGEDGKALKALAKALSGGAEDMDRLMSAETEALMLRAGPRDNASESDTLPLWVDRERAAFGAWYELFPRSLGGPGRHGTFRDVIDHLPYVASMGFDTLYFPPIHPIGRTNRKGKNNTLDAGPDDVGSPYAIGSPEGGFNDVHPALGTLEDFAALVEAARGHGLEIAIDVALNASPDHPWITEHPDWFEWRPDGTIKYAENPPKKYQDIVNFRYYMDDGAPNLPFWEAIRDIFVTWANRGVLSFRVDNPHTKPFPFWEWIIAEVRAVHPEAIFLSEAFTRPKPMKRLAKLGYTQSYGYFTWRTSKWELTEYLTELTREECRHYMRQNFFVNTPDINPVFLQTSGRPGFRTRLVMAASLSTLFGVYSGFELCEGAPLPGKEEYLDSEKFEMRHRDFDAPGNIRADIALMNRLRAEHPALRQMDDLTFLTAWDDRVLYYMKRDRASGNVLLFHVLLDPHAGAEFGFEVPLWEFGLPDHARIGVRDLVGGSRFDWHGKDHRLALDPETRPYAIWQLDPPEGVSL